MLHPSTVAGFRALLRSSLSQTCLIEREPQVTDEYGGEAHVWEVVSADVPCRLITSGQAGDSTDTGSVGSRERLRESYRLILPYDTSLDVNYRVTVGGVVYLVVTLLQRLADNADVQALVVRDNG